MNYANIKPWQRAAMLERAVLEKTPAEVSEFFRALGKTEFTARALGLACRYRGLETVKALVEGGAVFEYNLAFMHSRFGEFFGVKFAGRFPDHTLALIDYKENTALRHFNWLLEKGIPEDVKMPVVLPETERLEILEYLCDNAEKVGFKPGEFLFYLYFSNNEEMISALKKRGVTLSEELKNLLAEGARSEEWSDYCFLTERLADKDFIRVMRRLIDECGGKKLHFTEYLWHLNDKRFSQPEFFKFLLENFNQSKMNKGRLMKDFIDCGNIPCLEIAAENGWLKMPKKRDEMIAYATEKGKTECAAWLLDFKNRTADLAAERAKAEKKLERELNAAPDSVTELKKIWKYKKQKDGSVIIMGYKGNRTEITVPEKIGKSPVTEIGEYAFSPNAVRLTEEQVLNRCRIAKITVPASVRTIGKYAFGGSGSVKGNFNAFSLLEEVILPDTLEMFADKKSAENAPQIFVNCPKLTVKIPHSPYAEMYCGRFNLNYVFGQVSQCRII